MWANYHFNTLVYTIPWARKILFLFRKKKFTKPFYFNSGRIKRIWDAAQIWLIPLKTVFNVPKFKPALNWNLFWADLRRGSNSLNLDTENLTGSPGKPHFNGFPEAEFKEFEPRLIFKPQLKYVWFHLKLY